MASIYDFTVLDRNGNEVSLADYKDKVLLIVNTATQCGFTPQYDGLQDLYEKYEDQGFEVLDFPCDQFGHQAPGTSEEIHLFCDSNFGITFTQFDKIDVNGENEIPLYTYLKSQKGFAGFDPDHPLTPIMEEMHEKEDPDYKNNPDIKWNFTKFLIDRDGSVIRRFEPTDESPVIDDAIAEII